MPLVIFRARRLNPRVFAADKKANVAILFSLSLVPMLGMVGIGIDVARTISARTVLQASADAAALAAATEAVALIRNGDGTSAAQYAGTYAGQQVFYANATKVGRWIGGTPTPSVQVNPGSSNITALVSFSAAVPTTFGKMFGVSRFSIAGSASSSLSLPKYLNISVVSDISQSMGLAATSSGQSQLSSITGGCVFGCHVYQSDQTGTGSYESQAHAANIQLRIDVIRQAVQNMVRTAQQLQTNRPFISFSLYTMQGGNGTTDQYGKIADGQPLSTLAASSTDYTSLYNKAGTIDLGNNNSSGIGDTVADKAMTSLSTSVPTSGDGSSNNPQQFIFLLTDGVEDVWASNRSDCPTGTQGWNGSHCTLPFDPSWCAALKTQNKATVGVIYTTYLPIPGNSAYETLVSPFQSSLATNLKACASPGWYYEAADANDIQSAINALFAKATGNGVLTK